MSAPRTVEAAPLPEEPASKDVSPDLESKPHRRLRDVTAELSLNTRRISAVRREAGKLATRARKHVEYALALEAENVNLRKELEELAGAICSPGEPLDPVLRALESELRLGGKTA